MLKYRPPSTPVGIVTNACRNGQQVTLTDLEHMLEHDINMFTTIIIGNSHTFISGGWMTTPRGYGNKYNLGTAAP
jgi:precorrin-3B C17-methyltransferase